MLLAAECYVQFAGENSQNSLRYYDQAIPLLREAQKLRPTYLRAHRLLEDVFRRIGNDTAADLEQDRADAIEYPAAWPLVEKARQAQKIGEFTEAIQAADDAFQRAPTCYTAAVEAVAARLCMTPPDEDANAIAQLVNLSATEKQGD